MVKDLAIAVLGYSRPEYLYICLDSIMKADGKNIYLYFDGPMSKELMNRTIDTIIDLPIESAHFAIKRLGIMESHLLAFRETFNLGYEKVLFLEEDLFIRRDAIKWVQETEQRGFFMSLTHYGIDKEVYDIGGFNTQGLIMTRQGFDLLENAIRSNTFWGYGEPPFCKWYDHMTSFDTVWYAIAKRNRWVMQCPEISYVAHFGVRSAFKRDFEISENELITAEGIIFNGERSQWLDNLINLFKNRDMVCPEVAEYLYPRGFVYE